MAVFVLVLAVEEVFEEAMEDMDEGTGGGSLEMSVVITIDTEVSSQTVTVVGYTTGVVIIGMIFVVVMSPELEPIQVPVPNGMELPLTPRTGGKA